MPWQRGGVLVGMDAEMSNFAKFWVGKIRFENIFGLKYKKLLYLWGRCSNIRKLDEFSEGKISLFRKFSRSVGNRLNPYLNLCYNY